MTIRPHLGSVSTWTMRTLSQSASSSSATMRARAVPTCWPISARTTFTVTVPWASMAYQRLGSKAEAPEYGPREMAASAVAAKPKAAPAAPAAIRKRRRLGSGIRGRFMSAPPS